MKMTPKHAEFRENEPVHYRVSKTTAEKGSFGWVVSIGGTVLDSGDIDFAGNNVCDLGFTPLAAGVYELTIFNTTSTTPVEVLADSFVVGEPHVSKIELVRPMASLGLGGAAAPCVTYAGFVEFLATGLDQSGNPVSSVAPLGLDEQDQFGVPAKAPQATPGFGDGGSHSYERLMTLARDYAQLCRCHGVADFYPPGYLDTRRAAEPLLGLPRNQRPEVDLPCIELIWNYWQEEGMLVQTLNHVVARFQNRRTSAGDPLARFDVSPLLPLRSLLWSWTENEQRRLTVRRRAAEYEFEYGLTLIGRAVPKPGSYVERRSGFLQAFHTVLHLSTVFFKELDDLTITPDGFPLFEALREGHLVLSQGSQNQYGEMAVAARAEMLVMQHILAQAPMREFLGGRPMTPYQEPWMDRVDSMKSIQGWSDASVMHFHDLATFGERLVLTIRLGNWASTVSTGADAVTWATAFRPMIQRYIAAYRAVTGIDLATGVNTAMPSELIGRRLQEGRQRA